MLAEVGFIATLLAFAAALYAIVTAFAGTRTHNDALIASARNATIVAFPLLLVACAMIVIGLLTQQYQMVYIWSVSDPQTPTFFRITALWGSQAGSILFWSFLMSFFSTAVVIINWRGQRRLMPYVIMYTMAVLAFFLALSLFFENPFERYWILQNSEVVKSVFQPAGAVPPSSIRLAETANGLNPLLRHFGMIIHPPMLYLGFVGFIIPFAFAMAALASGDLSNAWIRASRRWTLAAWLFLSLGLILGGRWAYDVLGWGGYWGWDPVENAAFLPWLVGTAFLHSVMIQEKRGMLKVWNMFLVNGAFSAVIFGTFATRSGLVDSVHSFARSEIGFPLFFFWLAVTLVSVGLVIWRWRRGELRDEHKFAGLLSRESLFVLNNVIFILLFAVIFWGSFGAPIVSELFMNTNITLGRDYFLAVTPPLFLILYILMGVAPLSAWGVMSLKRLGRALAVPSVLAVIATGIMALFTPMTVGVALGYWVVWTAGMVAVYETYRGVVARHKGLGEGWYKAFTSLFARNRRRYGGYVIHLGIAIIGIGVIGSTVFQQETQQTLAVGQSLRIGDYQIQYDNFLDGQIADDGRVMQIAQVSVWRHGQLLANLRPRHDFYPNAKGMNSQTIAGAYSTIENDVYVLLVGWERIGASEATFKVYVNPLINLVWWGGLILIAGTLVATWGAPLPAAKTVPAEQPSVKGAIA
jgi:cytochrome c-type biogenesis protein CcmF